MCLQIIGLFLRSDDALNSAEKDCLSLLLFLGKQCNRTQAMFECLRGAPLTPRELFAHGGSRNCIFEP